MAETENKPKLTYSQKFYKTETNNTEKNLIYQGVMHLAQGFLDFDATQIVATGGGPVALIGRLASLQLAMPWLIQIATDTANKLGILSRNFEYLSLDKLQTEFDKITVTDLTRGEEGALDLNHSALPAYLTPTQKLVVLGMRIPEAKDMVEIVDTDVIKSGEEKTPEQTDQENKEKTENSTNTSNNE